MSTDDPHMSWCQARHTSGRNGGDCLLSAELTDPDLGVIATVELTGIPCDSQRLSVQGDVYDGAQVDELAAIIAAFRSTVEAGRIDVDCDLHPDLHLDDPQPTGEGCQGCHENPATHVLKDDDGTWLALLCVGCVVARGGEVDD